MAERDLDRDPPDDHVHHAAGGQAGPGQKTQDRTVRGPTADVPDIAALRRAVELATVYLPLDLWTPPGCPQQCKPNKIRRR
jgi:hypothetical protein